MNGKAFEQSSYYFDMGKNYGTSAWEAPIDPRELVMR
jgi:hypothetical protein